MGAACAECCAESRGRVAVHVVRFVLPEEEGAGSRTPGKPGQQSSSINAFTKGKSMMIYRD